MEIYIIAMMFKWSRNRVPLVVETYDVELQYLEGSTHARFVLFDAHLPRLVAGN